MSELKCCPFCGGEAKLFGGNVLVIPEIDENGAYVDADFEQSPAYVECMSCGAIGKAFDEDNEENDCCERAIEAWNTRKPMEKIKEELEEWAEENYQGRYDCITGEPCNNPCIDCVDDQIRKAIEIVEKGGAE